VKPDIYQLIAKSIAELVMYGISIFAVLQGWKLFIQEKSVGKTAINKIKEDYNTLRKELEDYKKDHEEMKDNIEHIESQYEKLIEKILNNFPFNK